MGNKKFSILDDGKENSEMYSRLNERSELERFRNNHSQTELDEMVERFEGFWVDAFEWNHEMRDPVPLHPWKVLKFERRAYAELESEEGDWPPMEMRHALRVVKDRYADKWRELAKA